MASHYLLPCSCGKKIEIDGSQAGLSLRCHCGAEVAVPTMRGLAALERVDVAAPAVVEKPAASWGPRQGLIFLGLLIVLASLLGGLYAWSITPKLLPWPDDQLDKVRADVARLTPAETGEWWDQLRRGIEPQVDPRMDQMIAGFLEYERAGWRWLKFSGAVFVLGLAITVAGLCTRTRSASKVS